MTLSLPGAGSGSIFAQVRTLVDNFWAQFLEEMPQIANPNLRASLTLTFQINGTGPAPVGAGYTVEAQMHSAASVNGSLQEGGQLQAVTGTTDIDSQVVLQFVLGLDVTQYYQVDLVVTAPDGTSATVLAAVILNPQPSSDWGSVSTFLILVDTALATGTPSSTAVQATITVTVGVYDGNGNPVAGASVAYWIVPVGGGPQTQELAASGTTDGSGSLVAKGVAISIVPSVSYNRVIVVNGVQYPAPGAQPGSSILALGGLNATVVTGNGPGSGATT